MSGTLQVGGLTLGTHNSGTGKVDITNAGTASIVTANVTGGTLGSSVVFPSGHVVQTKYYISTIAQGVTTDVAVSESAGIELGAIDIIPKQLNSHFLLMFHPVFYFETTTNYQNAEFGIYSGVGSGHQNATTLVATHTNYQYTGTQAGNANYYPNDISIMDTSVSYSAGQTITYEFRLGSGRGTGSVARPDVKVLNNSTYTPSRMYVMEIAQ
jgi:hypothetical protein